MQHKIPSKNLPALQAKIESLNNKARKLSCPKIDFRVLREEKYEHDDGSIDLYSVIEVSGKSPKINGWSFVATIDHGEGGNLLMVVPGETLPKAYRTTEPYCDHCHTNRRRKTTHVLRHESGEHKQVGSDCLRDFLGHPNPEELVEYAKMLCESETYCEEAESFERNRKPDAYTLERVLAVGLLCIDEHGWISRREQEEKGTPSTADAVLGVFEGAWYGNKEALSFLDRADKRRKEAGQIIKWVLSSFNENSCTDYQWNLLKLAKSEIVTNRTIAFAVSMIPCYRKAKEQEKLAGNSDYFGTPGKREIFELTLVSANTLPDSGYGVSTLLKFQDRQGNLAVWITTSEFPATVGKTYKIKATVKTHSVYKGGKQTVLSRCKLI